MWLFPKWRDTSISFLMGQHSLPVFTHKADDYTSLRTGIRCRDEPGMSGLLFCVNRRGFAVVAWLRGMHHLNQSRPSSFHLICFPELGINHSLLQASKGSPNEASPATCPPFLLFEYRVSLRLDWLRPPHPNFRDHRHVLPCLPESRHAYEQDLSLSY